MRKIRILFLLFPAVVAGHAFAVVDLQTLIRDVEVQQPHQRAGDIRFVVQGDDFPTASPSQPVYLRLRLDHGAVLQHSLINPNLPGLFSRPIYLALQVWSSDPDVQVVAPRDSVAIVRWRAGEESLWLRVKRPTDSWLEVDGAPMPPSAEEPVVFTIGQSLLESFQQNHAAFLGGHANLMFNKRALGPPTGTKLFVDLTGSNLQPIPFPPFQSILNFDPVAFDSTTQDVETAADEDDIVLGNQLPVAFSGDRSIARGVPAPPSKRQRVDLIGGDEDFSDSLLVPDRATIFPRPSGAETSLLHFHNPGETYVTLQIRSIAGFGRQAETSTIELEPGEIGTVAMERQTLGLSLMADGPLVILSQRSPAR